jgi:hypothetical protein
MKKKEKSDTVNKTVLQPIGSKCEEKMIVQPYRPNSHQNHTKREN